MKPLTSACITLLLALATPVVFSEPSPRFAVLGDDANRNAEWQSIGGRYTLDAINQLGIQYARGRGVAKSHRLALKMFRLLAMQGYTPGMVNLGTLYEFGLSGRRDHRLAYAWIKAALLLGVPESDYDATLFKLGWIAGRLGSARMSSADRLATSIVETALVQRESSARTCTADSVQAEFPLRTDLDISPQ
jgi:TPR repeat protein